MSWVYLFVFEKRFYRKITHFLRNEDKKSRFFKNLNNLSKKSAVKVHTSQIHLQFLSQYKNEKN